MLSLLKVLFIFFFFFLTLFLLYEEYSLANKNYIVSGIGNRRGLDILSGVSGAVTLITFIDNLATRKANVERQKEAELEAMRRKLELEQAQKNCEDIKRQLAESKNENIELKEKYAISQKALSDCENSNDLVFKSVSFWKSYNETITNKDRKVEIIKNSGKTNSEIQKELEQLNNETNSNLEKQEELASNYAADLAKKIGSSKFNNFDFNLREWINSLTELEMFAFIILCFNSIIWNALLSIVFIFYGDFLIKYFNLEVRYPKIAKFIEFRRKVQNFSVKFNLLVIFICTVPQIIACISVLWYYIT